VGLARPKSAAAAGALAQAPAAKLAAAARLPPAADARTREQQLLAELWQAVGVPEDPGTREDHPGARGDHPGARGDHPGARGDHPGASGSQDAEAHAGSSRGSRRAAASQPAPEASAVAVAEGQLVSTRGKAWPKGASYTWHPGSKSGGGSLTGAADPGSSGSSSGGAWVKASQSSGAHLGVSAGGHRPATASDNASGSGWTADRQPAARPGTAAPSGQRCQPAAADWPPAAGGGAGAAWQAVAGMDGRPFSAGPLGQQGADRGYYARHGQQQLQAAAARRDEGSNTGGRLLGQASSARLSSGGLAARVRGGPFSDLTRECAVRGMRVMSANGIVPPAAVMVRQAETELNYSPQHEVQGHVRRAPAWQLPPNDAAASRRMAKRAAAVVLSMPVEDAGLLQR